MGLGLLGNTQGPGWPQQEAEGRGTRKEQEGIKVRVGGFPGAIPLKPDNKLPLYSVKVLGEPRVITSKKENEKKLHPAEAIFLKGVCILSLQYGFPTACQRLLLCTAEGTEHGVNFSDSHELSRGKKMKAQSAKKEEIICLEM